MEIYEILEGRLYQSGIIDSNAPLGERHIAAIINLTNDPDALAMMTRGNGPYIRSPFIDGPLPYKGLLDAVVLWAVTHIVNGYPVLVHCAAGFNRSGLVSALIVRQIRNCTGREARFHVQQCRPGALSNTIFSDYLDSLPAPLAPPTTLVL